MLINRLFLLTTSLLIFSAAPSVILQSLGLGYSVFILMFTLMHTCLLLYMCQTRVVKFYPVSLYLVICTINIFGVMLVYQDNFDWFLKVSIKNLLFLLIILCISKEYISFHRYVNRLFLLLAVLHLIAFVIFNLLLIGFKPRVFYALDGAPLQNFYISFSSSRIYVDGLKFHRMSSIFKEPSTWGFVLMLLIVANDLAGRWRKYNYIYFLSGILTFSLGFYVSLFSYFLFLGIKKIFSLRNYRVSVSKYLGVIFLSVFLTNFLDPVMYVLQRLSPSNDGRLIAGDNRFYDDLLPHNWVWGDGFTGTGFDSIGGAFVNLGVIGLLFHMMPVLMVLAALAKRLNCVSVAAASAIILYLTHKPEIQKWIFIFLFALIYVGQTRERRVLTKEF